MAEFVEATDRLAAIQPSVSFLAAPGSILNIRITCWLKKSQERCQMLALPLYLVVVLASWRQPTKALSLESRHPLV